VTISGSPRSLPEWYFDAVPIAEIGRDDTIEFGRVGVVAFSGTDGLLVADDQASVLRRFQLDGGAQLLAGQGDGPGEIRVVTQLSSAKDDSVYAFDVRQNRFTIFGPSGRLATTLPVEPEFAGPGSRVQRAWRMGTEHVLLHGYALGSGEAGGRPAELPVRIQRDGLLQVASPSGAVQSRLVRFPGESTVYYESGNSGSPFWTRSIVATNGEWIAHGTGMAYELVVRDGGLNTTMVIRWGGRQETLTPAVLRAAREPMGESLVELRAVAPEAADRVVEALFEPRMLPDMLPAIGSVLLDDTGRIWVSDFRLSLDLRHAMGGSYDGWSQEDAWHVLSADGVPVARVRLPDDTKLVAVRGDRVAVVTRDASDVERVEVLALQTGSAAR
jgi:hypothetical protein